jgi:ankyrin repeat protein
MRRIPRLLLLAVAAVANGDPGSEALHAAVVQSDPLGVIAALDAGASLSARDALGYTPLHRAADDGDLEMVGLLLERGAASGDATHSTGLSARGKAIDARDNNEATALMLAAGGDHSAIVSRLVDAGASLTAADEFGLSALHYAAEGGHAQAVSTLLGHGADPDAQDELGKTSADVARAWGFPAVEQLLGPTYSISDGAGSKEQAPPRLPEGAVPLFPQKEAAAARRRMPDNLQPDKLEL